MNNEPVAWMVDGVLFNSLGAALNISFDIEQPCVPLYTHPAKESKAKDRFSNYESICLQCGTTIYKSAFKTLTDEQILTAIKSIADDVGSYKEYENTYEDGWLDACNTVYDEVFAILRKAQEK
jgi:hypothetical protein